MEKHYFSSSAADTAVTSFVLHQTTSLTLTALPVFLVDMTQNPLPVLLEMRGGQCREDEPMGVDIGNVCLQPSG